MKGLRVVLCVFVVLCVARVAAAQSPGDRDLNLSDAALLIPQHHQADSSGPAFTLDEIEQMALTSNPEIRASAKRLAVVEAHVPLAGALDDPSFMYRGWQVPLRQPWNYNAAQNMFMLSQALPGPGRRGLRTSVAEADVAKAKAALEATKLDVRVRARKAFYDLLRAEDELRIHDQHIDIARQAVEAAKIKYVVGKVPQQDILKAQVSLTRLAEHLIHFEQDSDIARGRLNTLLGRDPGASLNVRGEHAVSAALPALELLEEIALKSRPDLLEAEAAVGKSRREQLLAQKTYTPDFTVSAGYMLMPRGSEFRNDYMVEGSVSLPWLNHRKHDAEIAESSANVTEQDAELAAMRNVAFGQIQEALVQASAAQKLANIYQRNLQPQAEATLHSTVIAYENDRTEFLALLDSQMTVIDLDLAYFQTVSEFDARLADLELTVGVPIDSSMKTTGEVTQ